MTDDAATWQFALEAASRDYVRLPRETRDRVADIARTIRCRKGTLDAIAGRVGGGTACSSCMGACCSRGKYHFSLADLLVYLASGEPMFAPSFGRDACPFLGDCTCLMSPPFRPFTCITFICEEIETLLSSRDSARFTAVTGSLKSCYHELEELLGARLCGGLLHYGERALATGTLTIIRPGDGRG